MDEELYEASHRLNTSLGDGLLHMVGRVRDGVSVCTSVGTN